MSFSWRNGVIKQKKGKWDNTHNRPKLKDIHDTYLDLELNELNLERSKAISAFKNDVKNSKYPNSDYTISMDDGELDKLINELEKE